NLPPYGLSDLLAGQRDALREIVLVEGFFDLHQLRARGIENVAAFGGTSTRPQTFERLHRLGIEVVTLCLDNDEAGRAATAQAGQWLGGLPPRLALEQEDALRAVADQCGYSVTAVERAFKARFFREVRIERDRPTLASDDPRVERVIER